MDSFLPTLSRDGKLIRKDKATTILTQRLQPCKECSQLQISSVRKWENWKILFAFHSASSLTSRRSSSSYRSSGCFCYLDDSGIRVWQVGYDNMITLKTRHLSRISFKIMDEEAPGSLDQNWLKPDTTLRWAEYLVKLRDFFCGSISWGRDLRLDVKFLKWFWKNPKNDAKY